VSRWSRPEHRPHNEDGVVLVFVALIVLCLFAVASIVVDLGQGIVTGRQLQNASDAAALAGARALDKVRLSAGSVSATTVDATVQLVATRNRAQAGLVTCTVIGWDQTPLGPCSTSSNVNNPLADGVLVSAGAITATTFARVLGTTQLRQDRTAAATVQPLVGQQAPLLICAFLQPGQPDIFVIASPIGVVPIVYAFNPAAIGHPYLAHAPHVDNCGLASQAWKGDAGPGVFLLPGWLDIATGVQAGPIRSQIAGQPGCSPTMTLGCVLVLPVCSGSNGLSGIHGRLLCERFGVFRLLSQTANSQTFTLLAGGEATPGLGGTGIPGPNDARMIKLVL